MPARISVLVKAQAKTSSLSRLSDGTYRISVHALAQAGQANRAVIELLANHFSIPKSSIKIVSGRAARKKLIEICLTAGEMSIKALLRERDFANVSRSGIKTRIDR